jgi:hypothetical protein
MISEAVARLFPGISREEVFVTLFSEQGFAPGTLFRLNRRLVILRPEEDKIHVRADSPANADLNIIEKGKVSANGQLANQLLSLSGELNTDGTATFECQQLSFKTIDESDLQKWITDSKKAIDDAMDGKSWDTEPPLIVYKSVIGKYTLTVDVDYDDMTKVAVKTNRVLDGKLELNQGAKKHYKFTCKEPVIIAFCARKLTRDLKIGPAGPVKLGETAKTDLQGIWEQARVSPKK